MPVVYSDKEIDSLLQERKVLPLGLDVRGFRLKTKAGHSEGDVSLQGDGGKRSA